MAPRPASRAQLAAGLGYLALNQLDVVKVYAVGDGMIARSPRYTGRKQGADIFKLLRTLPSVPATNLGTALRRLPRRPPRAGAARGAL